MRLTRCFLGFMAGLVFMAVAHLALSQVPIAKGFPDFLIAYQVPAASRNITISDPGGDDTFVFTRQPDSYANKGWNRPTNAGAPVSLGNCTNGAMDAPSSDFAGRITFSGASSSCEINFSTAWGMNPPTCVITTSGATPLTLCHKATTTDVTFVPTSNFASGDAVSYVCVGHG